ncbi:MAG: hypothetical protein KC418_12065 [Anaerolineales bacterium]|nr:hypothetical protein [Anaerolineales bacterium]MCB8954431.1 hypothetical protein [Ardenticatenales bacterium]
MTRFTFKSCIQIEDEDAIVELLFTVKDELYLPDKQVIRAIVSNLFAHGGVIGAYHGRQLCGMMGYFLGSPEQEYANKEVAFLYVGCILPSYRLTRMFHGGLLFALQQFATIGVREIRLQAEAANPYTNRLYARFAQPLSHGKSLRGVPVITYGGSLQVALNHLAPRQRALPALPPPHVESPGLPALVSHGK